MMKHDKPSFEQVLHDLMRRAGEQSASPRTCPPTFDGKPVNRADYDFTMQESRLTGRKDVSGRARRQTTPSRHQVLAELAIRPHHSARDLADIRRRYALSNHPDRCQAQERAGAEARMKMANEIIDLEMRRRKIG